VLPNPVARTSRAARLAAFLGLLLAAVPRVGAAAKPQLRIEYLPTIVYQDEAITVSARVEADGQAAFRVAAALVNSSEETLATAEARGSADQEKPWRRHLSVGPVDGEPAALVVRLIPPKGTGTLSAVKVPILTASDGLPPLRADGMRFTNGDGRAVLVRIEHRVWERRDTWPLFRWLYHKVYGDAWAVSRVVVVGEALGVPGDGYLQKLRRADSFTVQTLLVGNEARTKALPVLRAAARLTREKLEPTPDLAVLALGFRDADVGTDVRQFHKALELMAQHLEREGCDALVVLGPGGPKHLRRRLAGYRKAARKVAHIYHGKFLDLGRVLRAEHFVSAAGQGQVQLRFPNPQGHAAMAKAVLEFLDKVTR
jgi:hypothetical protein